LVNNLLQLRLDAAARTTTRFVVNTTVGLGGLFDVAGRNGIAQQSGDFGQTLFVWGVSEGPYVVWPYVGPSTLRDATGSVVDMAANPLGWLIGTQIALATTQVAVTAGTTTVDAVDRLGQLKTAEDASIDFYSFVRSSYYQMRRAELREAVGLPPVVDSPALDDPDAESAVAAAPTPDTTHSAAAPAAPAPAATRSASKSGKGRSASTSRANARSAVTGNSAGTSPAPDPAPTRSAELSQ